MKSFILACLILFGIASKGQAQLSDAQIVSRLRDRPAMPQQARLVECANKPGYVAVATVGGAITGYFGFLFLGLGIMAADHGDVYRRSRNQWMLGGAMLFGGVALIQSIADDCIEIRRRRGRG